jgi:hypothetical protein
MTPSTIALFRASILVVAPVVLLAGGIYHPWLGNPGDAGFLARLTTAVAGDPVRWAVAHLMVAVGSGLLALAFLALRSYLREAGEGFWSLLAVPFVVMGSTLYALLPAMEFAPLAAAEAGADAAAVQAALLPWFRPILVAGAVTFALGVLGFATAIARSDALSPRLTWYVVGALVIVAVARFLPVGAVQLYVGPVAGIAALWPLAVVMWKQPHARPTERPGAIHAT